MATRTKKKEGFWDTYKDEGGGKYLTAAEKAALIDARTPMDILAVRYDEKNQFQGNPAPRYVVTFLVPEGVNGVTGGERFAGFAISDDGDSSRDRFLGKVSEALDEGEYDKIEGVAMERKNNFVSLVKA